MADSRVILGSDDEFDDDVATAYNESLSMSGNSEPSGHSETTASGSGAGDADGLADGPAGYRFDDSVQVAVDRSGASRPINIQDLTGDADLEQLMKSTTAKRTQTTMERLGWSSNRRSHECNSKTAGDDFDTNVALHEDDSRHLSSFQRMMADSSGDEDLGQYQRRLDLDAHPESSNCDPMPSSRETYGIGVSSDKPVTFEQAFQTQTTIPFTHPGNSRQSPPVVALTHGEMPSSGAVAAQIAEIGDFLEHEIAAERANVDSMELPSTATNMPTRSLDPEYSKSEPELAGSKQRSATQKLTDAGFLDLCQPPPVATESHEEPTQSGSKGATKKLAHEDENLDVDELATGLPSQMYQPQHTRTNERRVTGDFLAPTGSTAEHIGPKSGRQLKRRRTVGDSLDSSTKTDQLDMTEIRKGKGAKKRRGPSVGKQEPEHLTDGAKDASIEVQLPDQAEEGETFESHSEATKPVKRKRGRPKKAPQTNNIPASGPAEVDDPITEAAGEKHDDEKSAGEKDPEADEDENTVQPSKRRKRGRPRFEEESEDELAGGSDGSGKREENMKNASESLTETKEVESNTDDMTDKKPRQRGRKPKKQAEVASALEEGEEGIAIKHDSPDAQHEAQDADTPRRVPLKDNTSLQANLPLAAEGSPAEKEEATKEKSPQPDPTPQKKTEKDTQEQSPMQAGKVPHRVGLSRKMRIAPLLKTLKR